MQCCFLVLETGCAWSRALLQLPHALLGLSALFPRRGFGQILFSPSQGSAGTAGAELLAQGLQAHRGVEAGLCLAVPRSALCHEESTMPAAESAASAVTRGCFSL